MFRTNMRFVLREQMLDTKMCNVRTYVTHENMMSYVCTNVTYESV